MITVNKNERRHEKTVRATSSGTGGCCQRKECNGWIAYHARGEAGMLSRIINPVLGDHIAFCVERYNEASVMEQLDLRAARAVVDGMNKIL